MLLFYCVDGFKFPALDVPAAPQTEPALLAADLDPAQGGRHLGPVFEEMENSGDCGPGEQGVHLQTEVHCHG